MHTLTQPSYSCDIAVSPGGLTGSVDGENTVEHGAPCLGSTHRTGLARAGKGRVRPLTFHEFLEVRPECCGGLGHVL